MTQEFASNVDARVAGLLTDATFANQWAQIRSKHLLASISPQSISTIDYTYSPARVIRSATSALQSVLTVRDNSASLAPIRAPLRRAAEAMEYLANLGEGGRAATTRLIAAGLYQLAGLEANSLCLARSL